MTVEALLQELDAIGSFTDGHAGARIRALRNRLQTEGLQILGESPAQTVLRSIEQIRELEAEILATTATTPQDPVGPYPGPEVRRAVAAIHRMRPSLPGLEAMRVIEPANTNERINQPEKNP